MENAGEENISMVERSMFGGAMTCQLPEHWRDVSDVRQVPDHQECWQDLHVDSVFIIEILELQRQVAANQAADYFFRDLAESNGCDPAHMSFTADEPVAATSSTSSWIPRFFVDADAVLCSGSGYQKVAMGRDTDIAGNPRPNQEIHNVTIQLCVIRMPHQSTDLLVTLSTPSTVDTNEQKQKDLFRDILSRLQIREWSLFG
jgi:Ran-interacting Mog1 protein